MNVYNTELTHFGVKGMHWGKHKISQIQKSNNDYKTKINNIANSKNAHKVDIEAAKKVNTSMAKRVGKSLVGATIGTVINDALTGEIKNYKNMTPTDMLKKAGTISKKAATNMAIEEATARSVANKYNVKGERVKGSNNSKFTREQVAKTTYNAATYTVPILAAVGYLKLGQMIKQKKAGEAAFAKWGTRILTDKVSDYSHIIPNVNYSVS